MHQKAVPDAVRALEREGPTLDSDSLQLLGKPVDPVDLFAFNGVYRVEVDLHVARHWRGYSEVLVDLQACSPE